MIPCQTQISRINDILRVHAKSKNYRYRNLISQVLRVGQFCIDVGGICIFHGLLSLPIQSSYLPSWIWYEY